MDRVYLTMTVRNLALGKHTNSPQWLLSMNKKLTPYEVAEQWSFADLWASRLAKAAKDQCFEEFFKGMEFLKRIQNKLTDHSFAVALEVAKNDSIS